MTRQENVPNIRSHEGPITLNEGVLSYNLVSIAVRKSWSNKEGCHNSWPMTFSSHRLSLYLYAIVLYVEWKMEKAELEIDKEIEH